MLVRPAVEAGERLGFLPGDLAQKVDPYLRPLYDALYDLMGFDKAAKLFERSTIELAPLAYMRGRTLNHSFIILDEAQNTTPEQMKMFLTRIGFGTKAVITGDVTQIDLARGQKSGLIEAERVLAGVRGIAFVRFTSADVVRHPLVQKIIDAYERHDAKKPTERRLRRDPRVAATRPCRCAHRLALACSTTSPPTGCRAGDAAPLGAPRAERDLAVTLRFVGAREGRALNARYRGRDYATNVLTFVYDDVVPLAGDIVLCVPVRDAGGASAGEDACGRICAHLVVHGMLHLQGYDHERGADAARMEAREVALLARLGLSRPVRARATA